LITSSPWVLEDGPRDQNLPQGWNLSAGVPFTKAPYLPYRPKMREDDGEMNGREGFVQSHESNEEELFFLYSPNIPTTSPSPHLNKAPKAFPIAGAVADSRYK
jgi:hypothetical protein